MADIWDGIDDVTVEQKLPFLQRGSYLLELRDVHSGTSKNPKNLGVPFFKVNVCIIDGKGPEANAPGTMATYVIMKGAYDYYLKELKALVAAILNEPIESVTSKTVQGLEANKADSIGIKFRMNLEPKKGEGSFLKPSFFPIEATAAAAP